MKILISLFSMTACVIILFSCAHKLETKTEKTTDERVSTSASQIQYTYDLKKCSLQLDSCLNQCNENHPYTYLENSNRVNCRDSCIERIRNSDNCHMYYRSSRDNVFRASTTK